jgi:hypothetical protein
LKEITKSINDIYLINNGNSALTNTTALQSAFKNPFTTVSLEPGVYHVEIVLAYGGLSSNARTLNWEWNVSGTVSQVRLFVSTVGAAGASTLVPENCMQLTSTASTTITQSYNTAVLRVHMLGQMRVGSTASIQPRVSFSVAPGASGVIGTGSYIYFRRLNQFGNTFSQGNWS